MKKKKLSKSIRKFIRRKKAEIRRQFFGSKEAEEKIKEFVARFIDIKNSNLSG